MFVASVDADGDLVFSPSLHCKASDAQKLIFNGRQYALIFTCYIILIYPYFFGILSLSMGGERGGVINNKRLKSVLMNLTPTFM